MSTQRLNLIQEEIWFVEIEMPLHILLGLPYFSDPAQPEWMAKAHFPMQWHVTAV